MFLTPKGKKNLKIPQKISRKILKKNLKKIPGKKISEKKIPEKKIKILIIPNLKEHNFIN